MMPSNIKKICSFFKKLECAKKIIIVFVTLSDLNKTSNCTVSHTYKTHKTEAFYCESDMHVRPMRFSILCTPTDSYDKTQLMCCTILLCLFASKCDINGSRLNYCTVPCPATNLSILICKSSARTKQSVISVDLKTPPEIRLRICIYKTSLLHRSDNYIGFTPSSPPHFTTKLRP